MDTPPWQLSIGGCTIEASVVRQQRCRDSDVRHFAQPARRVDVRMLEHMAPTEREMGTLQLTANSKGLSDERLLGRVDLFALMAARRVLVKGLEPYGLRHLAFDINSGD
jgi:hypothetical protein